MTKKVLIEIPTETLSNVQNGTMDMVDVGYALRAIDGGEEQKVGKWIPMTVSSGRDSWKCSLCGRRARGKIENLPYCHCGARMEGADNE